MAELTPVWAILAGEEIPERPRSVTERRAPAALREWWEVRYNPALKAEADAVLDRLRAQNEKRSEEKAAAA